MIHEARGLRIGIIGCGWLGWHLAEHLSSTHKIYTTTRSAHKNRELMDMGYGSCVKHFGDDEVLEISCWEVLHTLDAVIITVPFSKREHTRALQNRFNNICSFIDRFDKQLFLMSTIGIYPDIDSDISEDTLKEDALHPGILLVEQRFRSRFPQLNILRLGGLMGGSRVFSNYNTAPTQQVVNHVHYQDICLIIEKMMAENTRSKTYNVVAPLHPTKQEVIDHQKGRKQTPDFAGFGRKITSDLLQKELNYQFLHQDPRMF